MAMAMATHQTQSCTAWPIKPIAYRLPRLVKELLAVVPAVRNSPLPRKQNPQPQNTMTPRFPVPSLKPRSSTLRSSVTRLLNPLPLALPVQVPVDDTSMRRLVLVQVDCVSPLSLGRVS